MAQRHNTRCTFTIMRIALFNKICVGTEPRIQGYCLFAKVLPGTQAYISIAICLISLMFAGRTNGQNSKILPEWKAHFNKAPVIANCVFERTTFLGKSETNLYQFRYQDNAFLMRQISGMADAASNHTPVLTAYAGRFESNYWAIGAGNVLQLFPNADKMMKERQNGDAALVYSAENMVYAALYYGIHGLDPKTMKWSQDTKFTALSISGEKYIGEVLEISEGRPTLLEWHFEKTPNVHFILNYIYDMALGLPYYPNEIKVSMKQAENKTLGGVYKIMLLEPSDTTLGAEVFAYTNYFDKASTRMPPIVFTNNDIYSQTKDGKLGKILPLSSLTPDNYGTKKRRSTMVRLIFLSFVVLSFAGCCFLWKYQQTNKRNNQ